MKLIYRIARTELATLFYSPIAWFILIVFSFLATSGFASQISSTIKAYDLLLDKDPFSSISLNLFTGDYGFWNSIIASLYIYIPLLTMGLISRETASGSIKLLYSSPITSKQIVFGKFIGAIIFGLTLMIVPIIALFFGAAVIPNFDWGGVLTGLLGLYLLTCTYCAIGLFMSSLTSYQVVAAIGTLIVLATLSFMGTIGQEHDFIRDLTYWLSIKDRTVDLMNGVLRSEDIIYFFVVIAMFLSFTILKISFGQKTVSHLRATASYLGVIAVALTIGYCTSRPAVVGFIDCTRDKVQTITPLSQQIMKELKGKVTVTNYVNLLDGMSFRHLPSSYKRDERLLEQYLRFKPDMKERYVYYYDTPAYLYSTKEEHLNKSLEDQRDYIAIVYKQNLKIYKTPKEIRAMVDLSSEGNTFTRIIEHENGSKSYLRNFRDTESLPSEAEITAAFKKLAVKTSSIGFIKGHGEREIHRASDFDYGVFAIEKYFRYSLMNQGFDVVEIDMSKDATIPSDINIIVISDMKLTMSESDYKKIDEYIARGGNMLIMADIGRQNTMNPLTQRFGITIEDGVLAQPVGSFYPDMILSAATKHSPELTFGFEDYFLKNKLQVVMPGCVALSTNSTATDFKLIPVLTTRNKGAWIEKETIDMKETPPAINTAVGEEEKAYTTALAAQRKIGDKEQRILVIGDADCFSNAELKMSREGYSSGNFQMITESFRWLSNGEYPIDTRRKKPIDNKLSLQVDSIGYVKILFLGVIPGIMLILGIGLWLKRRRN